MTLLCALFRTTAFSASGSPPGNSVVVVSPPVSEALELR